MAELIVQDLGRAGYEPTLRLQLRLVAQVRAADQEQAYLLLVEHEPPVITLGRGGNPRNVLARTEELSARGVEFHWTSRGGDAAYHGPGQLVAYPILRLDEHGRDIRAYLRKLEDVLISLLGRMGIQAGRLEGLTGVWVGQEKVAAIGVAIQRWVSYHGLAINVCPDLSHFDLIVPCGIRDKGVTSLSRLLGRPIDVAQVKPMLVQCMVEAFAFEGWREARPGELPLPAPG